MGIGEQKQTSYYDNCPCPKPKTRKKDKLSNGFKNKAERVCEVNGTNYADRHEIFGASNRQNSIRHGLQIDLSREEHEKVTNPRNEKEDNRIRELKIKGQIQFEAKLMEDGATPLEARKQFFFEFGRNYLEQIGEEGY